MLLIKNIKLLCVITFILGGLSVFSFSPINYYLLIYVVIGAYVFLLDYLSLQNQFKPWNYFILGYFFGLGYFAIQLYWIFYSLYDVIRVGFILSILGYLLFIMYLAIYLGLTFYFYVLLRTRYRWFNLLLLLPSIWTLFEWIRGHLFTGFPWCDVSYSQVNNYLMKGLFPIFGSYGVSFFTLIIIGLIIILVNTYQIKVIFYRYFILFIMLLVGLNLINNIKYTKKYGDKISVSLLQGNINENIKWNKYDYLNVYESLIMKAKSDLIIIPETAISDFSENLPVGYLDNLIHIVKNNNADLIIGIPIIIDEKLNYVNAALLLTNPKQPFYAKYHLVPYGEYIPLKFLLLNLYKTISLPMVGFSHLNLKQKPLIVKNQALAFNICYENGFNNEIIVNAKDATIIANISDMIWYGNTIAKDQHLQISQARALENQRFFLQDTNNGNTAVIDNNGNIIARGIDFQKDVVVSFVQGFYGYTPFQRYGNYLIINLCMLFILLGLLIKFIYNYKKSN